MNKEIDLDALFDKRPTVPELTLSIVSSDGGKWVMSRQTMLDLADELFWEINVMTPEAV